VRGTLIFDGNCGFCTRSRNALVKLDRHHRIATAPFQRPGTRERTGLTEEQLGSAVWWLDENGGKRSGAAAVNAALAAALGTKAPVLFYRLPGVRQAQESAYRWVARNRHRFPGTKPWCESNPEDC
jgi:predicted DCC family thiol-disulfide oxidoreductase YuxK